MDGASWLFGLILVVTIAVSTITAGWDKLLTRLGGADGCVRVGLRVVVEFFECHR